jgi:hypothetical protein
MIPDLGVEEWKLIAAACMVLIVSLALAPDERDLN